MPTVTFNITSEQHDQLKAIADSHNQSVQDYLVHSLFSSQKNEENPDEENALFDLKKYLQPRIEEAKQGTFSQKTIEQIKQNARTHIQS